MKTNYQTFFFLFLLSFFLACEPPSSNAYYDQDLYEIERAVQYGERSMGVPQWVTEYRQRCIFNNDASACQAVENYMREQERILQRQIDRAERDAELFSDW